MAEIIWTNAAAHDLNEIAEYIALSNPIAAAELVADILAKVERHHQWHLQRAVGHQLGDDCTQTNGLAQTLELHGFWFVGFVSGELHHLSRLWGRNPFSGR